jgi:hypothetical protein
VSFANEIIKFPSLVVGVESLHSRDVFGPAVKDGRPSTINWIYLNVSHVLYAVRLV